MLLNSWPPKLIGLLTAIDGLVVGITMELLFTNVYYPWEFKRAADYAAKVGATVPVERGPLVLHNHYLIPLLCVFTFVLATFLLTVATRRSRIKSVIFWELNGVLGLTLAFTTYFLPLFYRLGPHLNESAVRYDFLGLAWTWTVCILTVLILNFFFGVIVQITLPRERI